MINYDTVSLTNKIVKYSEYVGNGNDSYVINNNLLTSAITSSNVFFSIIMYIGKIFWVI